MVSPIHQISIPISLALTIPVILGWIEIMTMTNELFWGTYGLILSAIGFPILVNKITERIIYGINRDSQRPIFIVQRRGCYFCKNTGGGRDGYGDYRTCPKCLGASTGCHRYSRANHHCIDCNGGGLTWQGLRLVTCDCVKIRNGKRMF